MGDHTVELDGRWSLWRQCCVRSTGLPFELLGAFAVPELLTGSVPDDAVRAATADAMWAALADETFVAALTWQNPSIVDTWAGGLAAAARAGERPEIGKRNERERVVSRYAQRYATKNESIGFFGPIAWATFTDGDTDLAWTGSLGLRGSSVSYEVWAIAELARAWAEDPRVRPYLPVRLNPSCSVVGAQLRQPRRQPKELDPPAAALLAAVGSGPYAAWLEAAKQSGIEPAVLASRAEELRHAGVLQIGFLVPFDERPERHLRRQVAELPDAALRAELTDRLDDLDRARDRVGAVATDPALLHPAMRELASTVVKAGGTAQRRLGPAGWGRTSVYLDCRRDLDIDVGAPLLDQLRAPLGILLDSAGWLTAQVSTVVESHLREQYQQLRRRRSPVTLAELQSAATEVLVPGNPLVGAVLEDFQLRWAEIVPSTGTGPVELSAVDVRPLVNALFPAAAPGWAAARHHAPDLLLYRESDGRHRWVLGELHVAMNTVESRLFVSQADDRQALIDATAADFPSGRVVPLYPHDAVATNSRTSPPPALDPPGRFHYWSYAGDQGHELGVESTPASAVHVEESGGTLFGVADGWRAPATEFFGEFLTALCVNLFRLRPARPHSPRVLIDDLVVCRETWRLPAAGVPLPRSRPQDYTYAGIRTWAREHGLPRHLFVHTPAHPKPVYIDLAAPALLDNLARLIRATPTADLTITEMLPTPDQLWLTDPSGRHYTAELRAVAVCREGLLPVIE